MIKLRILGYNQMKERYGHIDYPKVRIGNYNCFSKTITLCENLPFLLRCEVFFHEFMHYLIDTFKLYSKLDEWWDDLTAIINNSIICLLWGLPYLRRRKLTNK